MVLSLAFVIAFIGAAVGLLIGITIFSEVEDSIICPAGVVIVAGTENYENLGSFGSNADAFYFESDISSNLVSDPSGIINEGVLQNGTNDDGTPYAFGRTQGEIKLGTNATLSQWDFFHTSIGASANLTSINLWIKGDVVGGPEYPIFSTMDTPSSDSNGVYLYTQSGATAFFIRESGASIGSATISSEPPDDSSWHMITVVIDKGNTTQGPSGTDLASIWIDGVKDTNVGSPLNYFTGAGGSSDEATIGNQLGFGGVSETTFSVDDFTIWSGYELTQSNIDTMYNSGSGSSSSGIGSSFQVVRHTFDDAQAQSGGGGGGTTTGSEECERAKDTAWTVIGIIPVALFFALFAIFGALGRQN